MRKTAVLIPAYNNQQGLEICIGSIEEEPDVEFEFVIVDDGSSMPIRVNHINNQRRINLVTLPENQGIIGALNAGLRFCKDNAFDYIVRLDCDDYAGKGRLESQITFLDENPDYVLIGGQAQIFEEHPDQSERLKIYPTSNDTLKKQMHKNSCFVHAGVAYRLDAVIKAGLYSNNYRHIEDYELFMRLCKLGKVANLNQDVVFYKYDPNSISQRHRSLQLANSIRVMLKNFNFSLKESYIGVFLKLVLLCIPHVISTALKKKVLNNKGEQHA
ncbi:glycosyltransferase [Terasakiella sp. A23]|uniref:glycosyltransferase n=1 Tax=Terasakiella sp. FCG-A23 TaxID=3080561 RepID=UPI00295549D7|nr:glycosyltransferase [Terasakiella sp. A23]MDV7341622.1 glycosyltransferase [Terasakiella sp. A23]